MDPDSILAALLGIFFLAWTAIFSFSETAMLEQSEGHLKKAAEDGDIHAERILNLVNHPALLFLAMRGCSGIGIMMVGLCGWKALNPLILLMFRSLFPVVTPDNVLLHAIAAVLTAVVLCILTVTLGLLFPRKIAVIRQSQSVGMTVVRPVCSMLHPLLRVCRTLSNALIRLFGMDPTQESDQVTEEEIRQLVDAGNESGVIEESQKEMINNIFEFDDRCAGDIMTHRTEVSAIEADASISEITRLATETGYSRFPVYEDTMDDIIGILYIKDLLELIGHPAEDFDIRSHMREALYVPESNRCRDLFAQFTAKKMQLAVVIDEYGGTSGIVTMEDLLESIVGSIQDEYDNEEEEFVENADGTMTVDGGITMDDLCRHLDWDDWDDEEEDYDTLSGLILEQLGYIPDGKSHPSVVVRNFRFTVIKMGERHIQTVKIEELPASVQTAAQA